MNKLQRILCAGAVALSLAGPVSAENPLTIRQNIWQGYIEYIYDHGNEFELDIIKESGIQIHYLCSFSHNQHDRSLDKIFLNQINIYENKKLIKRYKYGVEPISDAIITAEQKVVVDYWLKQITGSKVDEIAELENKGIQK